MNDKRLILVVNDDFDQLELLSSILREANYDVLTAFDGREAYLAAQREQPDLIISDVMMPIAGGFELCQLIRADDNLKTVPILLISGLRKDTQDVVKGLEAGADDYLELPFEPIHLIAKTNRLIERKRMEDAVRESENRFRSMIENMTDVITTLSLDGTILYESPAIKLILGYKPEELIGTNALDLIHPDDKKLSIAYFNQAIQQPRAAKPFEYRCRHKDGSWRIIESVGKQFNDPKNGLIAIINSRDITEQKKAFEEKRESDKRFRTIFNDAAVGIALTKSDGYLFQSNPALQDMLGYTDEELRQMHFAEFTHPEDVEKGLALSQELFEGKRDFFSLEKRYIKKSGETVWGNLTVSAFRTEGGEMQFCAAMITDITQRKFAEAALRQSEECFQLISRATSDALWDWDLTTDSVWRNEGFSSMFGYDPEDVRPDVEFWCEKVHPEDKETVINQFQSIIESSENYLSNEYRFRRADGSYSYVLNRSYIVRDEHQKPVRMIGAMMDITERKRAQEQLDIFFNVSVDLLCVCGFDGYLKRVNPAWQKTLGYSEEELLSKPFIEFVHPEDRERTIDEFNRDYQGQNSISFENRYRCKDGSYKWLSWNSSTVPEQQMIYAVAHDVTSRKKTEAALAEANERALREYDRLLRHLGALAQASGAARDLISVCRAILDFTAGFVPCSGICISLYNENQSARKPVYRWHDGKEVDVSNLKPINDDEEFIESVVKTGEVTIIDDFHLTPENNLKHVGLDIEKESSGELSLLLAPMKIKSNVIGMIEVLSYKTAAFTKEHATAMQMTANIMANAIENVRLLELERKKTEELQQAQKLESVGRLAGGIAHDFNNMLTAINGFSDLTLRQLNEDDPLRSHIEEIKKAGQRSAALTHQLLAFSRQQILKPKILDVNEVIIDISRMLQRLIGEDIQLNIVSDSKIGLVKADPGQLAQVIMNLAVNARDAMPSGGELTIETSNSYLNKINIGTHISAKPGSYVLLTVSDTGSGMNEETKQQIFDPFYTTKEVGKGNGLGLATVHGIINQSGGYIWVYSEVGVGTTFKVYLPRVDEEAVSGEDDEVSTQIPTGDETILLVEDEDLVRSLGRQILKTCGYKVIEARNGAEALSLYKESFGEIDLVLTDVIMPQMGGSDLAQKIKEMNPQIPLIYISGYTDDVVTRQGLIKDNQNFIQKPFTFEALTQKVREVLDSKDKSAN